LQKLLIFKHAVVSHLD